MKHIATIATIVALVIGGLCIAALAACSSADADTSHHDPVTKTVKREKRFDWEEWERQREERWTKLEADSEQRRLELEEEMAKNPPQKNHRRIRRFQWESPTETRGRLWNVPEEESEQATIEAFLRVCIAEADGNPQDCVGIWQVVRNNRRRTCDRGNIRRITECVEGEGETFLSALRRHQRHVLGFIKVRNERARWISKMTTDCETPPDEFLAGQPEATRLNQWDARYQKRCSETIELVRYLIKGELPPSRPGQTLAWLPNHPITWGGRCESGKAACDDQIACSRGLNRIPGTDTLNAFWCRPSQRGCPDGIDPICQQYRQKVAPAPEQPDPVGTVSTETPPSSAPQS